eukprot:Sspe_Gene.7078::Locus_2392_Transcript_2_2_Confidence_0.625_Length_8917::g.7078::m.7078
MPSSSIRVTPEVGDFPDIDCDLIYVIRFTIFNASTRMQRVRFRPPKSGVFKLVTFPQNISPGLKQDVEVEFCTKQESDYSDSWAVITDDGVIEIPLNAWFPRANLHFKDSVDLGVIPVQHNASETVTIVNQGKRPGTFTFKHEGGDGLTITPATGTVSPGGSKDVQVNYYGSDVGLYVSVVNVLLPGDRTRSLKVTAKVMESKVEMLGRDSLPITGPIDFGTIYFGQKLVEEVRLVNNSPFATSFTVHSPETVEEDLEEDGRPGTPPPPPMEVNPIDGRIPPCSSVTVKVTFQPVHKEEKIGFASRRKKLQAMSWRQNFGVEVVEIEQKLEVTFTGRALHADVTLSETSFRFGEVPVGERADIMVAATNNSELPVTLSVGKIAQFHIQPLNPRGREPWRLDPQAEMNLVATFRPNQLGKFSRTLSLSLCGGIKTIPLVMQGSATSMQATKKKLIGGTDKVASDFEQPLNFTHPASAPSAQDLAAASITADKQTKKPAWMEGSEEPGLDSAANEIQQKLEHQRLYNSYLTQCRLNREYNKRIMHERELEKKERSRMAATGTYVDRSLLDIGMIPAEGLKEPEPKLMLREEPLWRVDASGGRAEDGARRPAKTLKFDENRLIKKKFKKEPTTLNEQRECKMLISPKDIVHVHVGPKVLDFGKVSIFSKNVKSFFVWNDLKTHILVKIPVAIREELQLSFPASQVIPPGQTAGFDIIFQSDVEQNFTQAMWFQLNDTHKLKFLVLAEAVPIDVSLSQEKMDFRFNDYILDPTLSQNLTLFNNANTEAAFEWILDEGVAFSFNPSAGTIPANGQLNIDITYTPQLHTNESRYAAKMEVKGGPSRTLELCGSVQEAKCTFNVQKLDFGCVAVGSASQKVVTLRSLGPNTAVFTLSNLPAGMTVSVPRGKIPPGQSFDITVTLRPTQPQPYTGQLACTVRGMKQQLKLAIKAEAKIPQVELQTEDSLDFKKIFVGASEWRQLRLINLGNIPATLLLDLSEVPDFALANADRKLIDAATDTEDSQQSKGQGGTISVHRDETGEDSEEEEDEEGSEEEYLSKTRKGFKYKITVFEKATLTGWLVFTPTAVTQTPYTFPLMLSLAGIPMTDHASHSLMKEVRAEALKPRLVLSHSQIDFGSRVVVKDGTSKAANHIALRLTNEVEMDLEWELVMPQNDSSADVFRISPTSGKLSPGHTFPVQVAFTPAEVRSYQMRVAVYLDKNKSQQYMELIVRGNGANPALTFDRREIMMPVVPLEVPSRTVISINNEGYEALELKWRLPGAEKPLEMGPLPISLNFPEGATISQHHSQLAVEVVCMTKKPIAFTASIDFCDDEDGVFSIPVTFISENCLLTVFPFLLQSKGTDSASNFQLVVEGDRKPVVLRYLEDAEASTPRTLIGRSEARSHTGSGYDTDQTNTYQTVDRIHRKAFGKKYAERLRIWLNVNVFQDPVEDLLGALQANHGRLLVEVIEQLLGRAPPGALKLDRLPPNPKEVAVLEVKQYEDILTFLKGWGASLSDVRPEFLLKYEDYCRVASLSINRGWGAGVGVGAPVPAPKGDRNKAHRMGERRFNIRTQHAWLTVMFQIIKVFLLAKVTWKGFKSLPMNSILQQKAHEERWSSLSQEPSTVGSNIFSTAEGILLKWVSIHLSHFFPRQHGGENRVLAFEDLKDCRGFAALLSGYIPTLQSRFGLDGKESTAFSFNPTSMADCEKNAFFLLEAMKSYGMDTKLTTKDIVDSTSRDMLLLLLYLYNHLPQFVPQTTVTFKGKLHEPITKSVEISNPHRWPIEYLVLLDDDSGTFRMEKTDTMHLEPRSSGTFSIWTTPRFSKKNSARLTFLGHSRQGGQHVASIVFNLETEVDPDHATKTFTLESPLYEALSYEFEVANPFDERANFQIQYTQEYVREVTAKGQTVTYGEESSAAGFQDSFWMSSDSISIKKKEKGKMTLQFIPFIRGKYKCRVVFIDEKVGEIAYVFHATALPPLPTEKIMFQTEGITPHIKEVVLPVKNASLEKGAGHLHNERFKGFKTKMKGTGDKATEKLLDSQDLRYKVEYTSPFFTGPKEVTVKTDKGGEGEDGAHKKQKQLVKPIAFNVTFNPRGPGVYPGKIILTSHYDVRVIEMEGKSRSPGMRGELDFACTARQVITQEIPITNRSNKDWTIHAALTGEYFTGPREVHVKAGKTKIYPLTFSPSWVCEVQGTLVLRNNESLEKTTYTLRGKVDEPLAENTIQVECSARSTEVITISVPNISHDEITYDVETDIAFARGDPTFTVPKIEVGKYRLTLNPTLSGKTTGSITFTAPNKHYVWYIIQINTTRPSPETTIDVSAVVRQAVVAEITVGNPTSKELAFSVRRRGEGLLGDNVLVIDPRQSAQYKLIYNPLRATPPGQPVEGQLSFHNDEIGEYWYKLMMVAEDAPPEELPEIHCELGKSKSTEVTIENPLDQEITLTVSSTNTQNFAVSTPNNLVMKPFGTVKPVITFMPSAIAVRHEALIKFVHPKLGKWEYLCRGRGSPPTLMEKVVVHAIVTRANQTSVVFRNPFPLPKRFLVSMKEPSDVFDLLLKKRNNTIGPFSSITIPISYSPKFITENNTIVVVQAVGEAGSEDLKWEYPVVGVAEAVPIDNQLKFAARSRSELIQTVSLPLHGLNSIASVESFTHELILPDEHDYMEAVKSSILIEPAEPSPGRDTPSGSEPDPKPQTVDFVVNFTPLRSFTATVQLLVFKKSGGMWRYEVTFEALPPPPDDVIVLESAVAQRGSVSFLLSNIFTESHSFSAYFTPESAVEFNVAPAKGTMPPAQAPGESLTDSNAVRFVINFTSSQYGKTLHGTLVIETKAMEWRYEVRGTLPKYHAPVAASGKIDTRLREDTQQAVRLAASKHTDYIKKNQSVARPLQQGRAQMKFLK